MILVFCTFTPYLVDVVSLWISSALWWRDMKIINKILIIKGEFVTVMVWMISFCIWFSVAKHPGTIYSLKSQTGIYLIKFQSPHLSSVTLSNPCILEAISFFFQEIHHHCRLTGCASINSTARPQWEPNRACFWPCGIKSAAVFPSCLPAALSKKPTHKT